MSCEASSLTGRLRSRERGTEDQRGVEIELRVEGALDRLGAAEAVLFAGEQQIADRNAAGAQRVDHHLGLVRRHDAVVGALEEDDRAVAGRSAWSQRRALAVEILALGIGADQPVEIARLELVGVAGQRRDVADPVIARAALKNVRDRSSAASTV